MQSSRVRQELNGLACFLVWFGVCHQAAPGHELLASNRPPTLRREFRGAWVASVSNIDWPSQPGLDAQHQQQEFVAILDRAVQLKLNAIILQVRPACDALYASAFEPWSEYLTGQMGKAPAPYYDPLTFAVEQAHARGLELHAWFNPFRARQPSGKSLVATNHISRTQPALVRVYGKHLWLDPGEPGVREYCLAVILDVVKRYDIDGVHLDDYFYPYQEKDAAGKPIDFPDERSWKRYRDGGGKLSRADWRRDNVNRFIKALYDRLKAEKPWVKFGVSPFGIWRPGFPKQIKGFDAYEELYADSRQWLRQGWLDYLSPQLYWAIQAREQSYTALLNWWAGENQAHRHLWPGSAAAKVGGAWRAQEIIEQIQYSRKQTAGHILWNMTSLMRNRGGLVEALAHSVYAEPALVPASPWLDQQPPSKPRLVVTPNVSTDKTVLRWESMGQEKSWLWVLQTKAKGQWLTEILPGQQTGKLMDNKTRALEKVALTAIDRCGNAGLAALVEVKKPASPPARPRRY